MPYGQPPDQGGGVFAVARFKKAAGPLVPMLCVGMHTGPDGLGGASIALGIFGGVIM
ncbi:hypothetical protein [Desulfatibacillum aliphaticivorans]|uniref:hypothetical protein n=1 Tax=Desulfatibacillum aliphaticivorans TaxID=218208 RepID=UPI00200B1799|nr:hypothetical protein [Desulfatibacillum aliphaticivorans]